MKMLDPIVNAVAFTVILLLGFTFGYHLSKRVHSEVLPMPYPLVITVEKEKCDVARQTHEEHLAQRWKYLEPGPMFDMCFSFTGTIVESGRSKKWPIKPNEAIGADVCLVFQPEFGENSEVLMNLRHELTWRSARKQPKEN